MWDGAQQRGRVHVRKDEREDFRRALAHARVGTQLLLRHDDRAGLICAHDGARLPLLQALACVTPGMPIVACVHGGRAAALRCHCRWCAGTGHRWKVAALQFGCSLAGLPSWCDRCLLVQVCNCTTLVSIFVCSYCACRTNSALKLAGVCLCCTWMHSRVLDGTGTGYAWCGWA